ncbi:hypothetical protein PI124_g2452 [Phytophthora idaei]|nr:hypothetical protein PI124_g2452 [Phytophthora idaei]
MPQATDEDVELSLRLKLAVDMKEKLSRLDVVEVVSLMTTQQHLVMQLAEALLHTSYVPLQQLFFMSLTSLLSTMNSRPSEQTANVRERLCDNLGHLDKILLRVLPVDEVIEVIDQEKARWTRKQVNALNKSTQVCRTYILRKCWISSYGKDKLIPIAVDKWLDFGETLLTFYHQLPQETILYNLPYKCLETLEFDEERGLALISIKRVFGLDGINLVAFGVDSTEFAEFRDTLCAFKPGSVQILPTVDPERIRSDHRQVAQIKTTGFHYRVNDERLQPRSPIHRTIPTIPTISPIARPREPNLGSRNGFRTNLGKTRPQRGTFQQGHHRVHEETTQITALSAANLDS